MNVEIEPSRRVLVILDPTYGQQLLALEPGQPVWIADTPTNAPVVRSIWSRRPGETHLTGITLFSVAGEDAPEDAFIRQLGPIDLHHGPYSTEEPYRVLDVIGASLTDEIEAELKLLGFDVFHRNPNGFTAVRNEEAASRIQE